MSCLVLHTEHTWKNYDRFLFGQLETEINVTCNIFQQGQIQLHLNFLKKSIYNKTLLLYENLHTACITYHDSHWPFWFIRATYAMNLLNLFKAYIWCLLKHVDGFSEEHLVCLLNNSWNCCLAHEWKKINK